MKDLNKILNVVRNFVSPVIFSLSLHPKVNMITIIHQGSLSLQQLEAITENHY